MDMPLEFTITEDHLKLIKELYWRTGGEYCEVPFVNDKRPFGNSGFESDVAEILGWEDYYDEDGDEWLDGMDDKAVALIEELWIVMQICTYTLSFQTGTYYRPKDFSSREWRRR